MGTVCARCADMKKGKGESVPRRPDYDEEESEEDTNDDDQEEVAVSSDEDVSDEDYKQGVAETLKSTSKALKRGRTMAMKEAISTAKKYNIAASAVREAEQRLDDHKKQQRREEVEGQVAAFFASAMARDRASCEATLKKAIDADCSKETIEKLKAQLQEIIVTRDLAEDEVEQAREYLKESCREFVLSATKPGGRRVLLLDLESGAKIPSRLALDPPLQALSLRQEDAPEGSVKAVPLSSLTARVGTEDKGVKSGRGFTDLDDDEGKCVVALRYEDGRDRGVWCFVEPTLDRRDRLLEAFVVLSALGG